MLVQDKLVLYRVWMKRDSIMFKLGSALGSKDSACSVKSINGAVDLWAFTLVFTRLRF